MEALEVARKAAEAASDKLAIDIVLLNIREISGFADYFVICSGESDRQIKAIAEEVEHVLKAEGVNLLGREGTIESGWLLIDYGDVMIHIFSQEQRQYYQLEKLWEKASVVVRIQ